MPRARSRRWKIALMQALRFGLFASVVWMIHSAYAAREGRAKQGPAAELELAQVVSFFPTADSLGTPDPETGSQTILDPEGDILGYVLQTTPASDSITGYSGPTNLLLGIDREETILGCQILHSADTKEHVSAIERDPRFLNSWTGLSRDEAKRLNEIDAVSGSTLTCFAIQESVTVRLGGARPNLKFPDPVTEEEIAQLFPEAKSHTRSGNRWTIRDAAGTELGTVARSTPFADSVLGYQGPTEVLPAFDDQDRLRGFLIRDSFDNEPYVGYVREDEYFHNLFIGKSLEELAQLDLYAAQIEGVSGATMTSGAIGETLIATARGMQTAAPPEELQQSQWSLTPRDWGTIGILLGGILIGFTRLRGITPVRMGFQFLLIGYLGLINGDMVSQAFLVGAAQHGVPWKSTFGLVLLSGAAIAIPLVTRKQIYCHQICPHGAVQQLLKRKLPWQISLSPTLQKLLGLIPALLLLAVIVIAIRGWQVSLAGLEPFDAWFFGIAGMASITIAIVGLVASLFVPMAYCRFGCPTGAMLNFFRMNALSDRWSKRDSLATLLVLSAVAAMLVP